MRHGNCFENYDVTNWPRVEPEQMGSKRKFWCRHPDGYRCLFKFSRAHAGEDWSEKVAAEVAGLLGIPHAGIELAACDVGGISQRGTISRDFTEEKRYGSLVHGNELLLEQDPQYPAQGHNFRLAEHTLDRILTALSAPFIGLPEGIEVPLGVQSAVDLFAGYLLLDALIVNTDRHHENWGVLLRPSVGGQRHAEVAPTFDHASSLGRELTDQRRADKIRAEELRTDPRKPARRDQTIVGYLEKDAGRSRIFLSEDSSKPLHPMEVFRAVHERLPKAAEAWLGRLQLVSTGMLSDIMERMPADRMSPEAKEFSLRLLDFTRTALLDRTYKYG